jgi:hypothetical protein
VLYLDAEKWLEQRYKIDGKAARTIWSRARKHPDFAQDKGGRPTEDDRVASASFFKPYLKPSL